MLSRLLLSVGVVILLVGCGTDDVSTAAAGLVVTERCEITGLGVLASGDFAVGHVRGGDTGATGGWLHLSVSEGLVLARPDWILCRINGSTLGDFGGDATLNGAQGHTYRVSVQDRGAPGEVTVTEGAATVETLTASRSYRPRSRSVGRLPIVDRARVTIPSRLPVISGAPARGWAHVTFTAAETLEVVRCRYRGNGAWYGGGDAYELQRCGQLAGARVEAGDVVEVRSLSMGVWSGAWWRAREISITVNFDVTPLTVSAPRRDFYRVAVFGPDGGRVLLSEGDLVRGDMRVLQLD